MVYQQLPFFAGEISLGLPCEGYKVVDAGTISCALIVNQNRVWIEHDVSALEVTIHQAPELLRESQQPLFQDGELGPQFFKVNLNRHAAKEIFYGIVEIAFYQGYIQRRELHQAAPFAAGQALKSEEQAHHAFQEGFPLLSCTIVRFDYRKKISVAQVLKQIRPLARENGKNFRHRETFLAKISGKENEGVILFDVVGDAHHRRATLHRKAVISAGRTRLLEHFYMLRSEPAPLPSKLRCSQFYIIIHRYGLKAERVSHSGLRFAMHKFR